ncbi:MULTISPECIES: efflux RND transporter periplasmic adaptor subunit [unclassified Sulfitobacter]|jgi:membrane fusion protein (multidrug efflux system)|uniref:efflux RND transporter periplasmic adaptor subunit n=1 Tax=unclassified Sulfitobacter TaxID=196795 RepID=UPI001593C6EF|nr:efflux RND transporter periplasmic adaptor subunit [Sulfitobacter sp. HGT1]
MRFLRQSMIGLFLAATALGLLVFAADMIGGAVQKRMADAPPPQAPRERIFSVNVVEASPGTETPVLESFGAIQSRRTLELRAAVGGRVVELAPGFEDGGAVEAGQVLVRLDRADALAEVARAKSAVLDAEAEGRDAARALVLARDEQSAAEEQAALRTRAFQRQSDLADRGVGTATATETAELAASSARQAVLARRQVVTQTEARIDQAASLLSRSQIALEDAQRRLDETTIAAPFSGTLSSVSVVEGRLVSANERLAELIDPNDLEVSFRVSTAQYVRLIDAEGQLIKADVTATLDVAGLDLEATGKITRASAAAGEGASGRLIFASLTQAPGFKPGDFVTVRIREPELQNVIRLPSSALDAQARVLVLDGENRLEAVNVEVMRRVGDEVLVRGEIAGREVVEARSPLLGAGIAVKPLRPGAAPEEPAMIELTEERRAKLVAFVEANTRMPEAAKARVLAQLAEPQVPAQMIERLESRIGG